MRFIDYTAVTNKKILNLIILTAVDILDYKFFVLCQLDYVVQPFQSWIFCSHTSQL